MKNKKKSTSNMYDWAVREVELTKSYDLKNMEKDEEIKDEQYKKDLIQYSSMVYDAALEVFKTICDQGHSGMSIGYLMRTLNRMVDGKPLSPIEDVPEVWNEVAPDERTDCKLYQCNRCSGLFKCVKPDGSAEYSYNDSVVGVDAITNVTYSNGLINRIYEEINPITMPFMPKNGNNYIYTADFLFDKENGDFDTIAILYLEKANGERVEINRFFREPHDGEEETYPGWVEINIVEFDHRLAAANNKRQTNMDLLDIGLEEFYSQHYKEYLKNE